MSPSAVGDSGIFICFPRVSGDEPEPRFRYSVRSEFSPRERG